MIKYTLTSKTDMSLALSLLGEFRAPIDILYPGVVLSIDYTRGDCVTIVARRDFLQGDDSLRNQLTPYFDIKADELPFD